MHVKSAKHKDSNYTSFSNIGVSNTVSPIWIEQDGEDNDNGAVLMKKK